jgi:hypothetical protein
MTSLHDAKTRISPKYAELQRELHARPDGYGGKGGKWVETVVAIARTIAAWSVLDYGCGRCTLARALHAQALEGVRLEEYDPAVPGKDSPPAFADLVVCTDVLEHIEPDRLDAVLAHLHLLTRKAAFLVIALEPANKVLADGRNAHLIQESADWWRARLTAAGFTVQPWDARWPLPLKRGTLEAQRKRLITVVTP